MRCSLALTVAALCWVCYVTCISWQKCFVHFYFNLYELPAICSEGRPLHEILGNAEVVIDDTNEDDDAQVTLQCVVPIYVYYRHKEEKAKVLDESPWVLPVHKKENSELSLEKWRQRTSQTGVTCNRDGHPSLGAYYPHCSKKDWRCFDGKCSAYEKSRRLCAASIRKDHFSCYYIPGDPDVGTSAERMSFPFLPLTISTVATIWLLQWCWLLWVTVKRECKDDMHFAGEQVDWHDVGEHLSHFGGHKKIVFCLIGSFFFIGFVYTKIFQKRAQPDEDPPRGRVTYSIGDLTEVSLRQERPVPQSFWTLQFHPSEMCQVVLLIASSFGTLLYQRWLCAKVQQETRANVPQGPHRRQSMFVSQWRPQELEELADSDAEAYENSDSESSPSPPRRPRR